MKIEATSNELELSVRIRQYIEKTHESDITPESLTKVFLDNYKPKSEANEAVEFVDWKDKLHPSKNKECYTSNFHGHYFLKTNSELYEIFKTRNNK